LETEKCEYKRSRRSVRLPGKKGSLRLNSLSDDYTEEAIKERIAGKRTAHRRKTATADDTASSQTRKAQTERKFSLLIDVQNSIKAQNSPSSEHWSKLFNLKQSAKTLLFLQDNNLDDLDKLAEAAQKAKDDFNELQTRIHAIDDRLKEITIMQKHIGTYVKTKDIYAEYKRRKFSKKFYAENEKAINDCKSAKAFFDEKKLAKLPTINSLKQEYASLTADKKKLYSGYSFARNHMQEILMAQQNVHQLLDYRNAEHGRANDREER
jgi:predicted neutral ceramidase superfamily lipid hydrolase